MFSRCLTTRVTGYDQPPLQIMQMLYCFVNNIHVNYVELLWEGFHYSLKNPTTMIPYPRFRKLIASHYMTTFLEILRRARDRYHNLADDVIIKSIFNSGKSKDVVGMKIPDWMITDEMKLTENYRITSAHTTPNPVVAEGESSALRQSTVIRLRIPPRRSTRLIPPTPILTTDESDDLVLHDTLQVRSQSDKESSEVEKIVDISQPMNVIKEEEESTEDDYEFMPRRKFDELAQCLQDIMLDSLPKLSQADVAKMTADAIQQESENLRSKISSQVNDAISNHIPSKVDSSVKRYMSGHVLHVHPTQATLTSAQEQQHQLYLTMKDNPLLQQDNLPIWLALKYKFERLYVNSGKRQKTSEHKSEPGPSTSCNQEQSDDFYFWTNSYAIDDDVIPNENVSQELVDEISQTIDEAKLRKVVDEMKEILVPPFQPKPTPVIQICQRDSKAPSLSLVNQDLLYLKKGNSRPEKIELSLHKFLVVNFPDDDIEERTFRWVDKYVKRFNPYARYGVEHWKNPHAKIFYIKKQQEPGKPKEEIYSNSKIVDDYAKTGLLWLLSVFIRSTVIWERVHDFQPGVESYQQQVNLTAPTITFPGIKKYKVFSIISEPIYGIIYKNSKKEKRVMRHQEVHKFCDATFKRVLEGLKSYNNDVKHG
ncbi:hypothetical protein Tco_1028187 [Tanacetum coccineum]